MGLAQALEYASRRRPEFVRDLARFVSFPSVSADPARAPAVAACARWLTGRLEQAGLTAAVVPTSGHPLVIGRSRARSGRPTLLVYGHYDVQPAEPKDGWTSPPFEPVVRGAYLVGRGASDDKGQVTAHVAALESWLRGSGGLPLNVVVLLDGEEEIGSPALRRWLAQGRHGLSADAIVVSDTRMLGPDRPVLVSALRGTLTAELELDTHHPDLHSGSFGGALRNAIEELCRLVASLHAPDGRVAVAGFYDAVRPPGRRTRLDLSRVGPSDNELLASARADSGFGEPGFSLFERSTIRPALTVTGIHGGYAGPGSKSVIAGRAGARLSFRLVPDQQPADVARLLSRHVRAVVPAGVRATVRPGKGSPPFVLDLRHPAARAAEKALGRAFGRAPVVIPSGGSISIIPELRSAFGAPVVLMGFALPDDHQHGPDERFHLPTLARATAACTIYLDQLARELTVTGRRPAPVGAAAW